MRPRRTLEAIASKSRPCLLPDSSSPLPSLLRPPNDRPDAPFWHDRYSAVHLDVATLALNSGCVATAYCSSNNICVAKGCRRDEVISPPPLSLFDAPRSGKPPACWPGGSLEDCTRVSSSVARKPGADHALRPPLDDPPAPQFPYGYGENDTLPMRCGEGYVCPDEMDQCQAQVGPGETCQLDRDGRSSSSFLSATAHASSRTERELAPFSYRRRVRPAVKLPRAQVVAQRERIDLPEPGVPLRQPDDRRGVRAREPRLCRLGRRRQ